MHYKLTLTIQGRFKEESPNRDREERMDLSWISSPTESQARRTLKQQLQKNGTKVTIALSPSWTTQTWDPSIQHFHPGKNTFQLSLVEFADPVGPLLAPKGAKQRDSSVTWPALEVRGKTK
jgi:hypothetical protein